MDQIIERESKKENFFFVQIGSCDGVLGDPIHEYIIKNQWSGVLVEPVRYLFEQLVHNYKGQKNLIFENAAVSDEMGFRDFYYLKQTADPLPYWYNQLGSFSVNSILKHEGVILGIEKYIVSEKVRTITVGSLLEKHKVKKINFLHMDVEGYDYEILKAFPWSLMKPDMILFESKHLSASDYEEAQQFLRSHGYSLVKLKGDTFAFQNEY